MRDDSPQYAVNQIELYLQTVIDSLQSDMNNNTEIGESHL